MQPGFKLRVHALITLIIMPRCYCQKRATLFLRVDTAFVIQPMCVCIFQGLFQSGVHFNPIHPTYTILDFAQNTHLTNRKPNTYLSFCIFSQWDLPPPQKRWSVKLTVLKQADCDSRINLMLLPSWALGLRCGSGGGNEWIIICFFVFFY